jgi:hypothetical protein
MTSWKANQQSLFLGTFPVSLSVQRCKACWEVFISYSPAGKGPWLPSLESCLSHTPCPPEQSGEGLPAGTTQQHQTHQAEEEKEDFRDAGGAKNKDTGPVNPLEVIGQKGLQTTQSTLNPSDLWPTSPQLLHLFISAKLNFIFFWLKCLILVLFYKNI